MQKITIFRDENKVLCTDCENADYKDLITCKKLFEEIEKEKQWVTNPENNDTRKPIIIKSITFKI